MMEDAKNSCSPYLLKERRELAVACRQISEAHGQAAPPCSTCGLTDVCRRWPQATLIALPRPRRAPSDNSDATRAA
jgi:hypothetical protein